VKFAAQIKEKHFLKLNQSENNLNIRGERIDC